MENTKISDTEMKVAKEVETIYSKRQLEGDKEILENQLKVINERLGVFK